MQIAHVVDVVSSGLPKWCRKHFAYIMYFGSVNLYAKVGYSGATANTDSDSFGQASSSLSGYALGLGYKQVIRGGLYGYAELNYAKYKDVDVPYAQLSGEINATGMDVAVGIGWKF